MYVHMRIYERYVHTCISDRCVRVLNIILKTLVVMIAGARVCVRVCVVIWRIFLGMMSCWEQGQLVVECVIHPLGILCGVTIRMEDRASELV